MRLHSAARRFGSIFALTLSFALPALAALGGDLSSIQSDSARLQASARIIPKQFYNIHEMQTAAGTKIRQFVSPSGTVFAVSWEGTAPDLRQLLGEHFDEYVQAVSSQPTPRGHGAHIDTGDLVVDTGGHMRFVTGRAFLRSRVPSGVRSDEIR